MSITGVPTHSEPKTLSRREVEIIQHGRQGATDKEIGDALGLSIPTLRTYWTRIRQKLGATNRTHAIVLADVAAVEKPGSPLTRMVDALTAERVAHWVWQPKSRCIHLDGLAARMLCMAPGDEPVSLDRVTAHIWAPDRARFERYLAQAADLRPMTPIELRVGTPGDYRNLVRTVNLACGPSSCPALLLATTTIHVFS